VPPFFLMERLHGVTYDDYAAPAWMEEGTDESRASVTENFVGAIAAYNELPPLDLLGDALSVVDELRRWRGMAAAASDVGLVDAFDELEACAPPATGAPALVHGDPKPGNMLGSAGEVAGVLDLEMSFNGEPMWDLGYMLMFFPSVLHDAALGGGLPGMWDRETVIDAWEQRTGRSATDVVWFEAAATAKLTAILAYGAFLARSGGTADERMPTWQPHAAEYLGKTRTITGGDSGAAGARGGGGAVRRLSRPAQQRWPTAGPGEIRPAPPCFTGHRGAVGARHVRHSRTSELGARTRV
jgi:aminoglycoside phosphotransferase (APT) family kinase protein